MRMSLVELLRISDRIVQSVVIALNIDNYCVAAKIHWFLKQLVAVFDREFFRGHAEDTANNKCSSIVD